MLFENETPHVKSFWTDTFPHPPSYTEYESLVAVKSNKKFLKDFSIRWLGFKSPMIYFADVKPFPPYFSHLLET